MLPSWFLSQWISNTATAAMMVPVAVAVIDQSDMFASRDASSEKDAESGEISKWDSSESCGNTGFIHQIHKFKYMEMFLFQEMCQL